MSNNAIPLTLVSILADGKFHSYKELKKYLKINYAMIDRYAQTLLDWGLDVYVIPGKGYRIFEPIQMLNETLIKEQVEKNSVAVLSVTDSTNQYLINRFDTLDSGYACVAEHQQAGRGRRGNNWFSPFGSNIYLSIYWCLKQQPATVISLSLMISVVIAEVLHDLGADQIQLKWPNDLYLFDRKLAGILVELKSKTDNTTQIVIGTGINLAMRGPVQAEGVDQNWINLQEIGIIVDRNALAVRLIKEIRVSLEHFEQDGFASFRSRWERLNSFVNRQIEMIIGSKNIYGTFIGINKYGAILLEQNGVISTWTGREISLRVV